jgi:RNA polymerase sigma-70 factor (ECF subfamily)
MSVGPGTSNQTSGAATGEELAELLRRVARRDSLAFSSLYKQTQAKLYGVIARILTRGDLSGEVLQEVYVRIWEKAGDYDVDKGSPIAWMATIARNRALDEIRRVRPTSLEDMPEGFEPAAEEVDPLGPRDRSEQLTALMNCLKTLDEQRREVVLLAYYRGFTREVLSQRFQTPVPTIKTWLRRGLAQLRDCLSS